MLTDVGPVELWATCKRRPSAAAKTSTGKIQKFVLRERGTQPFDGQSRKMGEVLVSPNSLHPPATLGKSDR
jgi:hypothetical protein